MTGGTPPCPLLIHAIPCLSDNVENVFLLVGLITCWSIELVILNIVGSDRGYGLKEGFCNTERVLCLRNWNGLCVIETFTLLSATENIFYPRMGIVTNDTRT